MSFEELEKESLFTLDMDFEEMLEIPEGAERLPLNNLDEGELFKGKPQMSGIITSTFEDEYQFDDNGKPLTKTVHKLRLIIVNEDPLEYVDINLNLKKPDYNVDTIRKGSVLFDFIQSILEIENPGCTQGKNVFRNVNLKQFVDFTNNLKIMGIKVITRSFGSRPFNSFYVNQVNGMVNEKI